MTRVLASYYGVDLTMVRFPKAIAFNVWERGRLQPYVTVGLWRGHWGGRRLQVVSRLRWCRFEFYFEVGR